ncbi:MAG: rubredoxin [Rhodospirillaceae bacterium]|nr:rubredoxin [Rhodospirillaceae bacterium]
MSERSPARLGRRTLAVSAAVGAIAAVVRPIGAAEGDDTRYVCTTADCAPYVYDPALGNPAQGVPAGTPFAALPDSWRCPNCGSAKHAFIPLG